MVKDEDVCLHCGLCAERCPTGAWDMQKFTCRKPAPAAAAEGRTEEGARADMRADTDMTAT
jgi:ferredoxin